MNEKIIRIIQDEVTLRNKHGMIFRICMLLGCCENFNLMLMVLHNVSICARTQLCATRAFSPSFSFFLFCIIVHFIHEILPAKRSMETREERKKRKRERKPEDETGKSWGMRFTSGPRCRNSGYQAATGLTNWAHFASHSGENSRIKHYSNVMSLFLLLLSVATRPFERWYAHIDLRY